MSIKLVHEFNRKFGLPDGEYDLLIDDRTVQAYRTKFLSEELLELLAALDDNDRVKAFDALLDLVYVAQGTALFMGVTPEMWDEGMDAVHRANMKKVHSEAGTHKRGPAEKMIKPEGWVGPEAELQEILENV